MSVGASNVSNIVSVILGDVWAGAGAAGCDEANAGVVCAAGGDEGGGVLMIISKSSSLSMII